MKNFLANLAKRFLEFASDRSGPDTKSVSPAASAAFSTEHDGVESRRGNPPSSTSAISPGVLRSNRPSSRQPFANPNETNSAHSVDSNFITREELKRELDLLHRLIENRK
jgi:hypothetical protein